MAALPPVSEVEKVMAKNRYRNAQPFRGAGFRYLQQQLLRDEWNHSQKEVLKTMLSHHEIDLEINNNTSNDGDDEWVNPPLRKKVKSLKTIDSNMSDETILQFAKQVPSPMSLLASILKVLDDDGGNVSARAFLKTCALTVRPGWVPAIMDAKEMVLAALQFLSETTEWIRPIQQDQSDLEKRSYEKMGSWKFSDILPQIVELEEIFYEGTTDLTWLPRTRFVPPIQNPVEEDLLLLKGNAPAGSAPKKMTRKKKSNVPSAMSEGEGVTLKEETDL